MNGWRPSTLTLILFLPTSRINPARFNSAAALLTVSVETPIIAPISFRDGIKQVLVDSASVRWINSLASLDLTAPVLSSVSRPQVSLAYGTL